MKNNLFSLLKINIINSLKLKSMRKNKKILIIIGIIYIVGCISFTLFTFFSGLYKTLVSVNLTLYFIPLLFLFASLFSFYFTIFSAKAGLFQNKDNDLLLSLPINKKTVLLSRLLYITIYNLVISLLFIIPGVIVYVNNVPVNFMFYLIVVITTIFIPIIPSILASLFGYLIAVLTSKTKAKNTFELLYYFLFIIIYMLLFSNINKLMIKLASNVKLLKILFKTVFLPFDLINKSIITNNLLYTIIFIFLNLLLLFIFIYLLNKSYFKIIAKLNSHKVKNDFKMRSMKQQSVRNALRKKELNRYLNSPIYIFNTAFGVIFLLIAGIASFFYSPQKLMSLVNVNMNISTSILIYMIILFVISLTNTTSSSISIERENFWILKMLPVSEKEIFSSKIYINILVIVPLTILSLIMFWINKYIIFTELLLFILFTIIFSFVISYFGLIVNLRFPNLNAISDVVVVKQSISVLISIMVPFLIVILIFGYISMINISLEKLLIISIAISLILVIILKLILVKVGIARFKKIS